jgi:Ca2+-binding EF-hand superfamily protein
LFRKIDVNDSGTISFDEFESYLGTTVHEIGPRKKAFAGSRPIGYSGHRRKQSYYDSVGKASSNLVSTAIKEIICDKASSITDLFKKFDTNGDGVLSRDELRAGFVRMKLGLNLAQIDAMYDEIRKPNQQGIVELTELSKWLDGIDFVSVTMNSPTASPKSAWEVPESYTPDASPKSSFQPKNSAALRNEINSKSQTASFTTRSNIGASTNGPGSFALSRFPAPAATRAPTGNAPRRFHSSSQYRQQHSLLRLA